MNDRHQRHKGDTVSFSVADPRATPTTPPPYRGVSGVSVSQITIQENDRDEMKSKYAKYRERQSHSAEARQMFRGGLVVEGANGRLHRLRNPVAVERCQSLFVEAKMAGGPIIRKLTDDEARDFSELEGSGQVWTGAWLSGGDVSVAAIRLQHDQGRSQIRDVLERAIEHKQKLKSLYELGTP